MGGWDGLGQDRMGWMGWDGGYGGIENRNYKMLWIILMNRAKQIPAHTWAGIHSLSQHIRTGNLYCQAPYAPPPPLFSYGTTLATMLKVYILLLKGKASNKKAFIVETKLPLNPIHSPHMCMLVDIRFLMLFQ